MSWLWGCVIIFFKGCIGSVLFTFGLALIGIIMGLIGAGIGLLGGFGTIFGKKEQKKPEDWKEWADKQDGELKSLVTEIDKDLEDNNL